MPEITAHVMVRNEEYWIAHILTNICKVLPKVIVADCGSIDRTLERAHAISARFPGKMTVLELGQLSAKENGAVRQKMTDLTTTEWAAVMDGDEFYPVSSLENLISTPLTMNIRLAYSTLNVVDYENGFVKRETFNKQLLFYPSETKWQGDFPFDRPSPWVDKTTGDFRFYYTNVPGYDLAHLPRSSADLDTRHRHGNDGVSRMKKQSITGMYPEFLHHILPVQEELINIIPLNPTLELAYADRITV